MRMKNTMVAAIFQGLALVLVLNLSMAATLTFAGQPTDNVKAIIEEVMGILRNPAYQAPSQKANRLRLIEQSALRRVDYPEMAKHCLDRTWKTLSQTQRTEFVRMFTELLTHLRQQEKNSTAITIC